MKPSSINGPRFLIRSLMKEVVTTTKKARKFGGTVKSWAVMSEKPRPSIMLGRKRE